MFNNMVREANILKGKVSNTVNEYEEKIKKAELKKKEIQERQSNRLKEI